MNENSPELYDFDEYSGDAYEAYAESFQGVTELCALESIKSICFSIYKPLIFNVFFGFITTFGLSEFTFHWLSTFGGIFMLLTTIHSKVGLLVIFTSFIFTYGILFITKIRANYQDKRRLTKEHINASAIQYIMILTFVLFEYWVLEKESWLQIRGVMMVFAMKLISLVTDLPINQLPSTSAYFGYMFCSGNILFGPWISFQHYMLLVRFPTKKNLLWIYEIVRALFAALIFLTISNCWSSYFIVTSNRIITGYEEALSVRTSHYFISYLSEAFMLAAGWKNLECHFDNNSWKFFVTDFTKIEFPTSLSVVVVNWNKPMHQFLKKYIYRTWLPSGRFQAVLFTFTISSLFHGLERKISTVLICLGLFSYLQIRVRNRIADVFDICVQVHSCKSCEHMIKRDSILAKMLLLLFSLFTVLHLTFVGVLMDESTEDMGILTKWGELYYFSFLIMLCNLVIIM